MEGTEVSADIDRATELLERVPESELQRRFKWSCLQIDLENATSNYIAETGALLAELRLCGIELPSVRFPAAVRAAWAKAQEAQDIREAAWRELLNAGKKR